MGSNFTNFHAGCHGPVPLRGLFHGRTSRKRSPTLSASSRRQNWMRSSRWRLSKT